MSEAGLAAGENLPQSRAMKETLEPRLASTVLQQ